MLKLDLTGRLALVTGATGELGRVMVRTLADCGADVAVHYHNSDTKAAELVREIQNIGVRGVAVQADVTRRDSVFAMRDRIRQTLGEVDIVVANAVVQIHPWSSVLEEAEEDFESQFRSCTMQNVLLAKAFVPGMIAKKRGRYIGINTECAPLCNANSSAYSAAKRGMDGLLRVLAKEIGPHQITVNQVAPGWTISERDRATGSERNAGYEKNVPLARRGTDQEIANAVAFLASDLANFITGAFVPVSGGTVMPGI